MKTSPYRCVIALCIIIHYTPPIWGNQFVFADPNFVSTLMEYAYASTIKIGDSLKWNNLTCGGFIEIRNEKRFSECILPNHNWRGYAFFNYTFPIDMLNQINTNLAVGAEHESAHPSGGLYEANDEAYEMVYDGLYRNINLNALTISPIVRFTFGCDFLIRLDYLLFLFSKNTPELHDPSVTHGHGISGGLNAFFPITVSTSFFISCFGRYIAKSNETRSDWIYYDQNDTVVQLFEKYPILNSSVTLCMKIGFFIHDVFHTRNLSLFTRMLYGNPYGFIDSREKRLVLAIGIEIHSK
ncbi:MAG: hypothetical protein N2316_12120 [Spirochaetes bacterium]|nr:hypothetical protein [Spirochaetota bacterium]